MATVSLASKEAARVAAVLGLGFSASLAPSFARPAEPAPDAAPVSAAVAQLADWVARSGDNNGVPFLVVDKLSAAVFVYSNDGRLLAGAPALVGVAVGDDSTPGVGDRELSDIPPEERTTPAGRFVASFGPAKGQGKVLWVDFSTAISLHPVVTTNRRERRLERLSSPSVDDNRITYGCINVPADFYKNVVEPTLKDTRGIVYVLPDSKALNEVFPRVGLNGSTPSTPTAAVTQTPRLGDAPSGASGSEATVR